MTSPLKGKGGEPVNKFADGYRPKKKRESSRVKSEELSRKRQQFPTEACSIRYVENLPPSFIPNKYIHGLKSWDTFAFLRRFPIQTCPTPPLTPQRMLDACIQNFFRVSTLYRVGEGELQENLEKDALFYEGTQK